MTDAATLAQNQAADPQFSTWLSANAGSGKTRVLTDRVARLLLNGTEPQNILCLTYTKAAASEMQNRLFQRLGRWAMLDDAELRAELGALGEVPPASLSRARTLFARAVEAPGGLKIQTIHSFCSSVLRQFPLEAGVSPRFRELDEPAQRALVDGVLDDLAQAGSIALAPVARLHSDDTLTDLALSVARNRVGFARKFGREAIFRFFGLVPGKTRESLCLTAMTADDLHFLQGLAPLLMTSDKVSDHKLADALAALPDVPSTSAVSQLADVLLFKSGDRQGEAKIGSVPTKAMRTGPFQPYLDRFEAIMDRIAAARRDLLSLDAAERTDALHGFARAFLPAYAQAKTDAGALDFDDLIQKTGALLSEASQQWVLYRLDARIEHILVDEAQDTSPAQWTVIDALAREILAGEGARTGRSIFVVGDKKQSIYSFQGADARAFDRMRDSYTLGPADGPALVPRELHFSFRSSAAILQSVDTVFDGAAGRGVGQDIQHRAFHDMLPGRVDLWPLIPTPATDIPPEWYDPVDRLATNHPRIELAEAIAKTIETLIDSGTIPGKNGVPRRIQAGDFLILVQGRSDLFDHIIRACKSRNLPMAGADRLKIAGELAVKDLLALLSFLALQEDSLSLAAALKSPLFGWSEKMLYDLAQGRAQPYLWAELRDRKDDFPETFALLDALLAQVDFLRPFELLETILTRHDGRRRLLARLGPEAEDGIDELLHQALSYEQDAVPSLTGFLTRAQSEDVEIKRQSDSSGNLIRVMTVHGAKGLEAPIVILPDTTRSDKVSRDPVLIGEDGTPFWRMSRETCPDALQTARESALAAEQEERQRLLYVAMTRAEKWLIVCGTENGQKKSGHWHEAVQNGLTALGAQPLDTPTGPGLRLSHGNWPTAAISESSTTVTNTVDVPNFLSVPALFHAESVTPLSPSDLGGAKVSSAGARDEEAAKAHGRQMHRLLELLPGTDRSLETAIRILASGPDPMADDTATMLNQALRVIDAHPGLFASDTLAEVDVAAMLPTLGNRISGTIDRLVIAADTATAIDFKSNAIVPQNQDDVPEGILRQMGAYLEALEQVFPDKAIALKIIWTEDASETLLEHGIVRQALARTTTS